MLKKASCWCWRAIVVVLVLGMSRLLPKSMPLEKKRIAQYSMLISNGSLIGLPLIEGLCGSMGVVYANIFMIPTRILSFCSGEKYFNTEWKPAGALSVMKKFFFNPITIAMILGFLFNLARIPLPGGLDAVFSSLSGCMSPLALLLVGSTRWTENRQVWDYRRILCRSVCSG
ncbi:MAG: AEC family transporter [Holdemania filiformis]